jgi:cytochrome c oxidase subunit II
MRGGAACLVALGGCAGIQSAGEPSGRQAEITWQLFGLFLGVSLFFFLAVLVFLGLSVLRPRLHRTEGILRVALIGWGGLILAGLFGLTLASYATDRSLANMSRAGDAVQVRITAQQWWWQIEYLDLDPSKQFKTANELHLPIDRLTRIELVSDDVIHSLWLPPLAGKQDLIPGRRTALEVTPQQTGRFRGQCAEFCGLQHSRMALDAFVETPEEFQAWRGRSLEPANPPASALAERGYDVFMNGPCSACHSISGTPARGVIGPDLTHVASRATIAAGTLPNTLGHLEGWISNAQTIKPGARMPDIDLAPSDLHAVAAYLQGLT